jgi:predicted transcriptional regulator
VSTPPRTIVTAPTTRPTESTAPRQRRPVQETAELADEIEAMHPEISQNELARRLGISATRLRAVRREAREVRRSGASRA